MLTRRRFIQTAARATTGGAVVLVLGPLGCGADDSGTVASTSPTNPGPCDGAAATSNIVLAHAHYVCIPLADLTSPPAAGATYVTTLVDGHTHELVLTQGMLESINRGDVVVTTTTTTQNHQHLFSLSLFIEPAASAPPPSGSY